MTYNKIQKYIDLANRIFNCLNSKINQVNNSVIFVISPSDSTIFGEMKTNMTLKLYIYTIIYQPFSNDASIKNNILFTIIHELFHADQLMNLKEYQINDEYSHMMESQANFMTAIYMINNKIILEELFGFNILIYNLKVYLDKLQREFNSSIIYKRTNIFSYYYEMLKYIIGPSNPISDLLYYETNIEFHCEDAHVVIKENNIFNPDTSSFNQMVYDKYVKINRNNHEIIITKYESGLVVIESHIKGYLKGAIEFLGEG